jgi:hypothetical protein
MRKRLEELVDSGRATCSRCHLPIAAGSSWDLDHSPDRSGYLGPAHSSCNRKAGSKAMRVAPQSAPQPGKRLWSENWNDPNPPPADVIVLGGAL